MQGLPDLDFNIYRLALPSFLVALQRSGVVLDETAIHYLQRNTGGS
jgi:hypothetical protein